MTDKDTLMNLIDAYAETRHRCGGIYNAKTEAARKAVIEALSGVQALSAAPAVPVGWKLVPVEPTADQEWAGKNAALRCSTMGEACKIYKAMLAASPPAEQTFITPETEFPVSAKGAAITSESGTPPAEQQAAPKAAPESFLDGADVQDESGVLAYYSREAVLACINAALESVAAPKAAPGDVLDEALRLADAAPSQKAGL